MTATARPIARQVLNELDVAALAARIIDPERTRVVVVVTSGNRAPGDRLNADRIAAEAGPEVEVVALPTGALTYALERGLPEETNVFGDAARTYPVGTSWHTRPHLSPLRYCSARTDATQLEAQVISDARAAARRAGEAMSPAPRAMRGPARIPARHRTASAGVPAATPATLPGTPARSRGTDTTAPAVPVADHATPAASSPTAQGAAADQAPAQTGGPTPANPRGAPARPARPVTGQNTPRRQTPADLTVTRAVLSAEMPWHATSTEDGHALAQHLMAIREQPVLVVTTPSEAAGPLIDADDLNRRVHEIADVVVLHNGPASWALADAMPPLTQVYGGAGRVYPIDLGWLADPYRAPIRFCWPKDDPARVADLLEDDAFGAANLANLAATQTTTGTIQVTGKIKGLLGRHYATLWLDRRGGDSILLADQLYPGVGADRLLQAGQQLAGRIQPGRMLPQFIPDPIDDDPAARAAAAYAPGDVVLARVVELGAGTGRALLHPKVSLSIVGDDDTDLRNLVTVDDVVTLTIRSIDETAASAELADADAPSVAGLPVLPGGPPWLTEADLAEPEPAPLPEVELEPEPEVEAEPGTSVRHAPPATEPKAPTPATVGQPAQMAALTAQIKSLSALLERERQESQRQEQAAGRARKEAQDLRRQLKSAKAQHEAYRDRVAGTALFADPADQLRYDIDQTWLRRTPEPERRQRPLASYQLGQDFLESLNALEGIGRDKVLDVLVEVLTDRAKEIPGRELHQLRESASSQNQRVRPDGAKAWRCALQLHTPSARRLHFWRLPDGGIELDTVGTHDEGL